jgi:hypothetical protein
VVAAISLRDNNYYRRKEAVLFWKKRTKKLSLISGHRLFHQHGQESIKSFLLLRAAREGSKKEALA